MLKEKLLMLFRPTFFWMLFITLMLIFSNWNFAHATSQTWTYGDYTRDCQNATMGEDGLYYGVDGVITPTSEWTITPFTDENGTTYTLCGPVYYVNSATFNASTDRNTYGPGETVYVFISGTNGIYASGEAPAVGVSATFGSSQVAQCNSSAWCSDAGSFVAPTAAGSYTINLTGCNISGAYCANSTMNISVDPTASTSICGQDFTSSGFVTIPAGVTGPVTAKIVGAGGGGGGSDGGGDSHAGGGGGGGGYRHETIAATAGQVVNVTVGTGGSPGLWVFNGNYSCGPGGTSGSKNGNDGQSSSVSGSFGTLTATGGQGGGGNTSDNGDGHSGSGGSPGGGAGGPVNITRNHYDATYGGFNGSGGHGFGGSSNATEPNAWVCPTAGQNGFIRVEWACPTATPSVTLYFGE